MNIVISSMSQQEASVADLIKELNDRLVAVETSGKNSMARHDQNATYLGGELSQLKKQVADIFASAPDGCIDTKSYNEKKIESLVVEARTMAKLGNRSQNYFFEAAQWEEGRLKMRYQAIQEGRRLRTAH